MKNKVLLILLFASCVGYSQTNLVPNPTFNKIEKKIKGKGQINVATPWTSPTLAQADLYVKKTKIFDISIPVNSYGDEDPMDGEGYAGIIAYSPKNKVPRSYLQVQLTQELEGGKDYCVRFHVSLADLSKYACNHMGIAVTENAMTANNSEILRFESYIESRKMSIYDKQFYWTPVCGVFKAKGNEKYITIGNFEPESKLKFRKVKRPKGVTKPQINNAYYYIDNVSIILLEEVEKCDCDVIPGMENVEIIKRDFSSEESVNASKVKIINTDGTINVQDSKVEDSNTKDIDGMIIEFDPKSYAIGGAATMKIDGVIAYMKANNKYILTLTGYIDASEGDVDKLDGKRVGTIYKYLVSKGIPKERIKRELGGNKAIDKKQKTKNMRVEISLTTPPKE